MESWRQELYHSFRHAAEGSTWKDHKYIAIVDGRYIYPEDVQNAGKNSYSNTSSAKSGGASASYNSSSKKTTSKNFKIEKRGDKPYIKGNIEDETHLPKNPAKNDVYYVVDKRGYLLWDGSNWVDYTPPESNKKSENNANAGTLQRKSSSGNTTLSKETIARARAAINKLLKR